MLHGKCAFGEDGKRSTTLLQHSEDKNTKPNAGMLPPPKGAVLVVTDSIPVSPNKQLANFALLSVSRLLVDASERIHFDCSVSELFG